jgi:2-methylisocitrate lyase-like PEP mutase family enzyme
MSELAKRIGRVLRRESAGGMGFAAVRREPIRAMLLAARARDAASAKAAIEAGADVVLIDGIDPADAGAILAALPKGAAGVRVDRLDEATAAVLQAAGTDFVISPLATTASAAVDTERMGQVVAVTPDISDSALRSLAALGFDALFVEGEASAPTLAAQLELVRLASFSTLPLAINVEKTASVGQLRVLRDSGAAVAVAPADASAAELRRLIEALVAVPPPRRPARGGEIALVPMTAARHDDDEIDEPE